MTVLAGAALAAAGLAGCAGGSGASVASSVAGSAAGAVDAGTAAPTSGPASPRPRVMVGVTAPGNTQRDSGALVVLDPATGATVRTLVPQLVVGDAVQVSPDGRTVFYEKVAGCSDEIWSVPVAGGTPQFVTQGGRPAVSPDGKHLAYATNVTGDGCYDGTRVQFSVGVRAIGGAGEYNLPQGPTPGPLPAPVSHLSWNRDGTRLAVSVESVQDNEGWDLRIIDPKRDRYYQGLQRAGTLVPQSGPGRTAPRTFVREAVFLPDGSLFAVHRCCDGWPPKTTLERLDVIDATRGALLHEVAIGVTTKDHTGLDTDVSGHWLLYLAGGRIMVSEGGARPKPLGSQPFQAVDW